MKFLIKAASPLLLCALSAQALAAPKLVVQPVQLANESIRYNHGIPTVDQESQGGSVQVRPAPMDHGSFAFNIAVFNDGKTTANLDTTNFTLSAGAVSVSALTADALEKKAKSRAAWSQVGLALVGGIGAAAAASQRDTYRSTFYTPRAVYHSVYSAPSAAGQIQAAAIAAGTGVGIASIQSRLDEKLEQIGNDVIQMTTVAPGESYAGLIVFEKVKLATLPAQVTMTVNWNGIAYPFSFQIAKPGTPAPPFKPAVLADEPAPPVLEIPVVVPPAPTDTAAVTQASLTK